jgi:hypothetical protein
MYHGFAIGADLEIRLDGVISGDGRVECRGGIFDYAGSGVMQASMRDRLRGEPVKLWN